MAPLSCGMLRRSTCRHGSASTLLLHALVRNASVCDCTHRHCSALLLHALVRNASTVSPSRAWSAVFCSTHSCGMLLDAGVDKSGKHIFCSTHSCGMLPWLRLSWMTKTPASAPRTRAECFSKILRSHGRERTTRKQSARMRGPISYPRADRPLEMARKIAMICLFGGANTRGDRRAIKVRTPRWGQTSHRCSHFLVSFCSFRSMSMGSPAAFSSKRPWLCNSSSLL